MNKKTLLNIALGTTVLGLTACEKGPGIKPGPAESARIMEQEQSQVALLLNKDFSTSIVAINNGKRIKPCKIDQQPGDKGRDAAVRSCYPEGHDPDGKILFEETYKVTVREGSTCISITVGSHVFDFCDPPYDLGF